MSLIRTIFPRQRHALRAGAIAAVSVVAAGVAVADYVRWSRVEARFHDAAIHALSGGDATLYDPKSKSRLVAHVLTRFGDRGFVRPEGMSISLKYLHEEGEDSPVVGVRLLARKKNERLLYRMFPAFEELDATEIVEARIAPDEKLCVMALDPGSGDSITNVGGVNVNLDCGIAAAGIGKRSVHVKGYSAYTAKSLYTAGSYSVSSYSVMNITKRPLTRQSKLDDPYHSLTPPKFSGCDHTAKTISGEEQLKPGVYCRGIHLESDAVVTLAPGVYILDKGSLSMQGGASLSGRGVTFFLTDSEWNRAARANISKDVTMTLSAPTSGPYAGVLFYQDPEPRYAANSLLIARGGMDLTGALYFPRGEVHFGGSNPEGACTQLVARRVVFRGDATLVPCKAPGVRWDAPSKHVVVRSVEPEMPEG